MCRDQKMTYLKKYFGFNFKYRQITRMTHRLESTMTLMLHTSNENKSPCRNCGAFNIVLGLYRKTSNAHFRCCTGPLYAPSWTTVALCMAQHRMPIYDNWIETGIGSFLYQSNLQPVHRGQWNSFGGTSVEAIHALLSENSCLRWQPSIPCLAWIWPNH